MQPLVTMPIQGVLPKHDSCFSITDSSSDSSAVRFCFSESPRGDLRAEVKQVVWHEVAHWLGYETEEQVEALGL